MKRILVGVVTLLVCSAQGELHLWVPFGQSRTLPWVVHEEARRGVSIDLICSGITTNITVPIVSNGIMQAGISQLAEPSGAYRFTNGLPLSFCIHDWRERFGDCTSVVLRAVVPHLLPGENREMIGYLRPGRYEVEGRVILSDGESHTSEKRKPKLSRCIWSTNWPAIAVSDRVVHYTNRHLMRHDREVIYKQVSLTQKEIMDERLTILWSFDEAWCAKVLQEVTRSAPAEARWTHIAGITNPQARALAFLQNQYREILPSDSRIINGPLPESYEITTTRLAVEEQLHEMWDKTDNNKYLIVSGLWSNCNEGMPWDERGRMFKRHFNMLGGDVTNNAGAASPR